MPPKLSDIQVQVTPETVATLAQILPQPLKARHYILMQLQELLLELRTGVVRFHKDLAKPEERPKIVGGGSVMMIRKTLVVGGSSNEFHAVPPALQKRTGLQLSSLLAPHLEIEEVVAKPDDHRLHDFWRGVEID